MATFNKFNAFVAEVGLGNVDLNTDTLKILLTNTAPVATNTLYGDISGTELANGAGYTTGGTTVGSTAYSQTSGTAKLTGNAVTFTSTGSMGPFRYAVIYDVTPTSPLKPLIGWWDYGSSITPTTGETFVVASDTSGSNWTSGAPILTIA